MQNLSTLKKLGIGTGILLAVASVQQAQAAVTLDLAGGIELWSGDTTYQIGGNINYPDGSTDRVHSPLSELEWPMDMWMAGIDLSINFENTVVVNGELKKNISDPDDPMKDSDWGIWYLEGYPRTTTGDLDIYSESDISSFDATIFDLSIEWIVASPGSTAFSIGVGYQEQTFEYEATLDYQNVYYLDILQDRVNGDGRTAITYEITYTMPYLMAGFDAHLGSKTRLEAELAYSPMTDADDEDHHLLRENGGKISTGNMDGDAFMFECSIKHNIAPNMYVEAGVNYTLIDVDGTQNQVYGNGRTIGEIDETSESSQLSEFVRLGVAL